MVLFSNTARPGPFCFPLSLLSKLNISFFGYFLSYSTLLFLSRNIQLTLSVFGLDISFSQIHTYIMYIFYLLNYHQRYSCQLFCHYIIQATLFPVSNNNFHTAFQATTNSLFTIFPAFTNSLLLIFQERSLPPSHFESQCHMF